MEVDVPTMIQSLRPALFLDRDGTINVDKVYINHPDLLELIPGAAEAIRKAKESGYFIVVVSNQSGIARGIIEEWMLPKIHARLDELLLEACGEKIDLYQICEHAPWDECECRKPKAKLVQDAAKDHSLDIPHSYFIGDKMTDVEAGLNAGCRGNILLRTGKGAKEEKIFSDKGHLPDLVAEDLLEAVNWILAKKI
jgi:histidinol-phosphate phosphatase family protein